MASSSCFLLALPFFVCAFFIARLSSIVNIVNNYVNYVDNVDNDVDNVDNIDNVESNESVRKSCSLLGYLLASGL